MVSRQNADIADTVLLRDVAMATPFWLSMGYNFSCVIASGMIFDSRGGFLGSSNPMKTANFEVLRDVAMATIFWLSTYGEHIGDAWQTGLNCPCAAEMRPYVKLLY